MKDAIIYNMGNVGSCIFKNEHKQEDKRSAYLGLYTTAFVSQHYGQATLISLALAL